MTVDQNAAGQGWLIDLTPATDAEFSQIGSGTPLQAIDPRVIDHEFGHPGDLRDLDFSATSLMSSMLPTGVRRLPGPAEIDAILTEPGIQ